MSEPSLTILLAEDDDGHAHLVRRNLQRAGVMNEVVRVNDGQQALDYLRFEGAHEARPPHERLLLLLDINMPCIDGMEVLRQVKADEQLNKIPVVMLTTTDDPRDIDRCYELGCAIYVTKPVESGLFVDAVQRLGLFLQFISTPSLAGV